MMFFLRAYQRTAASCSALTNRSHIRGALRTFSYSADATPQEGALTPARSRNTQVSVTHTPVEMGPSRLSASQAQGVLPFNYGKHRVGSAPSQPAATNGTCSSGTGSSARQPLPGQRVWDEIPNWCSLCVEPLNIWNEHLGKRDHICLEMIYNALVHYERRWDPCDVWADADDVFCCATLPKGSCDPVTATEPCFGCFNTSPPSPALACAYRVFDQASRAQRHELLVCLQSLMACGVIQLTPGNLHPAAFTGALVLFKEQFAPLAQLFPLASAKEVSCLTQMIASSYNFETVFDLCGMDALVSPALRATRVGPPPRTAATPNEDDDDDHPGAFASGAVSSGALPYEFKGVFCRALLGALRGALEPDDDGEKGPAPVLAAHTARLLIAQVIESKLMEYVARVEGVFRDEQGLAEAALYRFGNCKVFAPPGAAGLRRGKGNNRDREGERTTRREQLRAARKARAIGQPHYAGRSEVVPSLPNWGMMQYMDGALFYNEASGGGRG